MTALRFTKITICNFKSYVGEHTFKLDRKPGLYFISGKNLCEPALAANGAGKSGLWDALLWCLFEVTADDNRPAGSILPWASGASPCVQVEFNGQAVRRTRKPNELVHIDSKGKEHIITNVDVEDYLGLREDMFRRAVVVDQFTKLFLDLKAEQQAELFNESVDVRQLLSGGETANKTSKELGAKLAKAELQTAQIEAVIAQLGEQVAAAADNANAFELTQARDVKRLRSESIMAAALLAKHGEAKPENLSIKKVPETSFMKEERALREADKRVAAADVDLTQLEDRLADYDESDCCPTCEQPWPVSRETKESLGLAIKSAQGMLDLCHKDVDFAQARLNKCKVAVEGHATAKLAALEAWETKRRPLAAAAENAASALRSREKAVNPHVQEEDRLRKQLGLKREALADLKKAHADAAVEKDIADAWETGFKVIRLDVIDTVLDELGDAVNRHAAALGLEDWRIEFATERETQAGTTALGFTATLYPPDATEPVRWKSYSGGERQRWQLAMTFGLSEVLLARAGVEPNIEVFDEPTRGLSEEGVDHLLETLAERARDLGRVIFITDHHAMTSGAFAGHFLVTKDTNGSRIERVF